MAKLNIKFFGIDFKTSYTNLAIMTLFVLIFEITLFKGFLMFLCIVLHELGHIFAMCKLSAKPSEIQLGFFDLKIVDKNVYKKDFTSDVIILLMGPAMNILSGLFFLAIYTFFKNTVLLEFCLVNILLGIFNLMPVSFLDGGQILFSFLSLKHENKVCENLLFVSSFVFVTPFFIVSILIALKTSNFYFLLLAIYLAIMTLKK